MYLSHRLNFNLMKKYYFCMFHEHKINKLNYFSSISEVANFRVLQSRTTSILEGGDDEDIAKIESRTTLIQEGGMMRTSPRWTRLQHRLSQVATHLQLSCHVTLGFSRHIVNVSIKTSSYDIKTGRS